MLVKGDIVIDRPVEDVFDFVADERNEPKYNHQMTVAEMLTNEPIGMGSKFHSVMQRNGVTTDMAVEYTEFDRPRRIASRIHGSNMDFNGALLFEPKGAGTKMTWLWNIELRGFYRLLGPLVRRMGERQELSIWTGLKSLMEAQAQPTRSG
ncbi:MAG TPA: SRPBCC family protein [Candidatus Dormibacteraeota bacterium]|nr:SRPBCC family protein [Candidatus Dormibacteraeota bacterium]